MIALLFSVLQSTNFAESGFNQFLHLHTLYHFLTECLFVFEMLAEYRAKLESLAVTPQTFRAIVDKAHKDVKN